MGITCSLNFCCLIFIVIFVPGTVTWHGFDNTDYHCWDLTASASNTLPITCEGFTLRWMALPGDTIKAQTAFNITFELLVEDAFYTWAYDNSYFSSITSVTNAAEAKTWCLMTNCPVASSATVTNCCVWHVNVHSCPLAETINGLCGPWILPSGGTFTHSEVLVGNVTTGNWTCHVQGLYQLGVTSLIAHFKIAGMQIALETKVNVIPKTECGDGKCEEVEGEDCEKCPADCGNCPLKPWQLALIGLSAALVVGGIVAVFIYFQYQKRKLLWDESWIIPYEHIKQDDGLRGAFGSMIGSTMDLSVGASEGSNSIAVSAARRQMFAKTAMYDGRTCAIRDVKKKDFGLTQDIRWEVKEIREKDHSNLCKFVGASIEAPNVCILTEYCPKGSLSDVLLNDDVPINWAFRFSFASDIARGMHYLHSHKMYHGRLTSNNCVVDDRWAVKITDYGLMKFRKPDEIPDDDDEDDDYCYHDIRSQVYKAPEFLNTKTYEPTAAGDVYAYAIILIEIATRNDPYGDEDANSVPLGWKPPVPDLSPEMSESKDDVCPCPSAFIQLIRDCWLDNPEQRPSFEIIKKTLYKINPNKLSPVDLMMAMMEKYSKHLETIVAERTQDLVTEKAKTDRLLYSMLPKSVADDLRLGRPVNAEIHDACTIYFSDIVGFTTISGASTPMQVVALLNKLYITFDEIIDKYDVYKVETIGDAYMVVSGIPVATPFHAREVADMAIDLVQACTVFSIPHMPTEPLKIRVGLHSGSACAGVVGLKMPRYCLFGDTVNTASRMESNGEAYRIHISNFTYNELTKIGGYLLEKRGLIPVKGKGDMLTWWLNGHDPAVVKKQTQVKEVTTILQDDTMNNNTKTCLNNVNDIVKTETSTIQFSDKSTEKVENEKELENKNILNNHMRQRKNGNVVLAPERDISDHDFKELLEDKTDNDYLFTPVELPDAFSKIRKISNISNSNDSGYNDRGDIESLQEIMVRSCGSIMDWLGKIEVFMMKLFDMQEEFYSSEIQLPRKNGWTFGNMKNDDTTSSECTLPTHQYSTLRIGEARDRQTRYQECNYGYVSLSLLVENLYEHWTKTDYICKAFKSATNGYYDDGDDEDDDVEPA